MYYTCEKCHINYREDKIEELLADFIYDMAEYDMAVKKYFLLIISHHKLTKMNELDKEIQQLEKQKNENLDLDNMTFSPQQLMADRDIERETMIRLDTLNIAAKANWGSKFREEKQEFIFKLVESVIIKKDSNN